MVLLNRRAFMAVTAAGVVAPTGIAAQEKGSSRMDWMTMSLEALKRPATFTFMAVIGNAAVRRYLLVWLRAFSRAAGRRRCLATL